MSMLRPGGRLCGKQGFGETRAVTRKIRIGIWFSVCRREARLAGGASFRGEETFSRLCGGRGGNRTPLGFFLMIKSLWLPIKF